MNTKSRILNFLLSKSGTTLVFLLFVLFVYLQTYQFVFIWDDTHFITPNDSLKSWRYILRWFYDGSCYLSLNTFWRPVRNFSFLADWYIGGCQQRSMLMHLHNVLLHFGVALLLLWTLRRMVKVYHPTEAGQLKWQLASFSAALLWAIHPLCTETVCWIKCRDEEMFTFFYIWGMGIFLGGMIPGKVFSWSRCCAVTVLGALSVLTKEMALSYPLILGLLWFFAPRDEAHSIWRWPQRRVLATGLACCVVMVLYIIARSLVLGQLEQIERQSHSFYYDMLTMVRAYARYIELTVIPVRLLADYAGFPVTTSILSAPFLASLSLIIICTVLAIIAGRRYKLILVAWCAFWCSMIPISNIVPTMQYLAERFMYLPLTFFAIIAMVIMVKVVEFLRKKSVRHRIVFGVLTVCLFFTVAIAANLRVMVWKNPLNLFWTTWRDGYDSPRILYNGLNTMAVHNMHEEAIKVANVLLSQNHIYELFDETDKTRINQVIGRSLLNIKQYHDEALSHTLVALYFTPDDIESKVNLGIIYGMDERTTEALEIFETVLKEDPKHATALSNKATALKKLGRYEEARIFWHKTLEVNPDHEIAKRGLKSLDELMTSGTAATPQ